MLYRSKKESQKVAPNKFPFEPVPRQLTQHGSPLLDVPGEILAAIFANLDPPALLALARTHHLFARHIDDDSTWRSAFHAHYSTDLFRRTQPSWRAEFSKRHGLLLRFGLSRVPSTTHAPLPAPVISRIHFLSPAAGLLSLSLTYGIVARSVPANGRVLPGFLDASGSTAGRGPNAEFTPNVSACALASSGGTVRLLWGYRTGNIAFMLTNRTMENPRRTAAEFRVSLPHEMHSAAIADLDWVDERDVAWLAVSGGSDGLVKVWDFSSPSSQDLLWTSRNITLPIDPCVKVAANRALRKIAAVRMSGAIDVWLGFNFDTKTANTNGITIPASDLVGRTKFDDANVLALHIDRYTGSILVAFHGDVSFYRIDITAEGTIVTSYGAPEGGAILSSIQPHFILPSSGEKSFVLTGDKLGCVSVYHWGWTPPTAAIRPDRSFQAIPPPLSSAAIASVSHSKPVYAQDKQESVTALAWTPVILATGTSAGIVALWDSLTFQRIRVIVRPVGLRRVRRRAGNHHHQDDGVERPDSAVKQILVGDDGDTLIINLGGEVISWSAGDVLVSPTDALKVGKSGRRPARGGGNAGRAELSGTTGRWSGEDGPPQMLFQLTFPSEMKREISESHAFYRHGANDLEAKAERGRRQRAKNERDHSNHLKKLGLSEREALEYVLMLSRERMGATASGSARPGSTGDAAVDPDVDITGGLGDTLLDGQVQAMLEEGVFFLDENLGTVSASSEPSEASQRTDIVDEHFPQIISSADGHTRIISRTRKGSLPTSPLQSPEASSTNAPHPASLVPLQRKLSIASSISSASTRSNKSGSSRSSGSGKSAWHAPLVMTRSGHSGGVGADTRLSSRTTGGGAQVDLDDDLRFALELSLAEARSRGEGV